MALLRILLAWILCTSSHAFAVELGVSSNVGLMQQPSSQYYHLVYGATASVQTDSRALGMRYEYAERPKFNSAGFSEQESAHLLLAGGKIYESGKSIVASALFGAGRVSGYITPNATETEQSYQERSYTISGPALELELAAYLRKVKLSAHHQTLVGISSKEEMKAYVAWPYAFYGVAAGFVF